MVSQNRCPIYYKPYYGDPKKVSLILGISHMNSVLHDAQNDEYSYPF